MKRRIQSILFLILLISAPQFLKADIIYPARLEIKEVEPGIFRVTFNLPIVNKLRLKARPVLPSICEEITAHNIHGTTTTYTETWQLKCEVQKLFGKEIRIGGLIGKQIDIVLFLQFMDGRSFTATLKPSKAVFVIPFPESKLVLTGKSLISGMQKFLVRTEMFVLLSLLVFLAMNGRTLIYALVIFLVTHGAGQYLAQQQWLQLSSYIPPLCVSSLSILISLKIAQKEKDVLRVVSPLWLVSFFLGIMYGGADPQALPSEGLSQSEYQLALFVFNIGVAGGVLLIYLLFTELRQILILLPQFLRPKKQEKLLIYAGGTFACAIFFYQLSAFIFFPNILPGVPLEIFIFSIMLGVWWGYNTASGNKLFFIIYCILFITGIIVGLNGISIPFSSLIILGSLCFLGISLSSSQEFNFKISTAINGVSVLFYTVYLGSFIQENLSKPIANAVGVSIFVLFIFYISFRITEKYEKPLPIGYRLLGVGVVVFALWIRLEEYLKWFDTTVAIEYALGLLRIPILSIVFMVIALLVWPRKRKIHQHLNIEVRKTILHLILIGLAFFMLPYGTYTVKNLFFTPDSPHDEQAQRILQKVLSNTYNAFNLDDENKVYDQLSQSVSGDLVADLYLDSRRRLTAGVRQGAEVTVRKVKILSVGKSVIGSTATEGFSYNCKWMVTARVNHLQHVHHRQNIYTGRLTIKVDDKKWKIARVDLTSEDRVVIPWRAG
jgi:hydrogenase/urease accessory protein HupE